MKRPSKLRKVAMQTVQQDGSEPLREQIPLSDMSDCLLAVYDEVSRRAFQRCIVRGEHQGSDREDWKAAEDDLFARISVDFEESGGNLYALASLPGCAGTQITVAVDECWLLICGYADHKRRAHVTEDFGEYDSEDDSEDNSRDSDGNESTEGLETADSDESYELRNGDKLSGSSPTENDEHHPEDRIPGSCEPRPFCVVALRAKVDPGRSVAVLSNGLLAIRMGKAGMETPIPCVA
jgi:HSP20 family molecular chaperone IbpA